MPLNLVKWLYEIMFQISHKISKPSGVIELWVMLWVSREGVPWVCGMNVCVCELAHIFSIFHFFHVSLCFTFNCFTWFSQFSTSFNVSPDFFPVSYIHNYLFPNFTWLFYLMLSCYNVSELFHFFPCFTFAGYIWGAQGIFTHALLGHIAEQRLWKGFLRFFAWR